MLALTGLCILGLAASLWTGCSSENSRADSKSNLRKITFSVPGMCCGNCALKIKEALEQYDGVDKAYANFLEKRAWARYDPEQLEVDILRRALISIGYKETTVVSDEPYEPEPLPEVY